MRLATFNILHGRSVHDGRVDVDRLASACASLDAGVLGLQEVDREQARSSAADLAAAVAAATGAVAWRFAPALIGTPGHGWRAALHHPHGLGHPEADEPSYGVALLSRYPVSSWDVVRLAGAPVRAPVITSGGERRLVWIHDEPRVALVARVHTPYGEWTVATTHLSFVPGWNVTQLRRLARALRRHPPPRVLLGDLNLTPRLARVASGWRSLGSEPTFPAHEPRLAIDQVLGDGRLPRVTGVTAIELPVSDHRALAVDLGDRPEPGEAA